MTTISGAGMSAALASWTSSVKTSQSAANDASPAGAERWVSLGERSAADSVGLVYSRSQLTQWHFAWSSEPTDDLSRLMVSNLGVQARTPSNQALLLNGVGAQLLARFATTSSDFKQTVVNYSGLSGDPAAESDGATEVNRSSDVQALEKAKSASNSVHLTLQTVSGKTVNIALSFGGNSRDITSSLSVEVKVEGTLDDAEQAAVAALATGFEKALQTIGDNASSIDVSGLVGYDTHVLASVDLSVSQGAQVGVDLQSLSFHADAKGRRLAVQRTSGHFAVEVDFSRSKLLGSAEQQQNSVSRYLEQFDADNRRGHGDRTRMQEFKTAFAQMNTKVPGTPAASSSVARDLSLDHWDRSVLSGLADFKATLSNDFTHESESGVTIEAGHLDYQVSQATTIQGLDKYHGLSVSQVQSSRLKSVFAQSRGGEMLDTSKGNFNLTTIDDETSVETSFAYFKNKLQNATVQQLVKQMERVDEFFDHKRTSSRETPVNEWTVEDISDRLKHVLDQGSA